MQYSTYLWLICILGCLVWFVLLYHTLRPSSKLSINNIWPFQHVTLKATQSQTHNIQPVKHSNLGKSVGVYSIQGQRQHMEDSYFADVNTPFFGVYDGHGGARCSTFVTECLHDRVLSHNVSSECELALKEAFKQVDTEWLDLASHHSWDDGSTAVCGVVSNNTLYVASIGDSRAVLCSNGRAVELSQDHKPSRGDEKQRIESLGGRIIHYGTWRVEGVLAVTRAFGDRRLKKYVSSEPEIQQHKLNDNDDWLILATDGVWDVLSSQAVCDICMHTQDCKKAAEIITLNAYKANSADNITAMVIDLRQFRK